RVSSCTSPLDASAERSPTAGKARTLLPRFVREPTAGFLPVTGKILLTVARSLVSSGLLRCAIPPKRCWGLTGASIRRSQSRTAAAANRAALPEHRRPGARTGLAADGRGARGLARRGGSFRRGASRRCRPASGDRPARGAPVAHGRERRPPEARRGCD